MKMEREICRLRYLSNYADTIRYRRTIFWDQLRKNNGDQETKDGKMKKENTEKFSYSGYTPEENKEIDRKINSWSKKELVDAVL